MSVVIDLKIVNKSIDSCDCSSPGTAPVVNTYQSHAVHESGIGGLSWKEEQ